MTGAPLVLGLDVGGSTTRVLLADLDGRVLAGAEGAGGNPVAHGETAAAQRILDTLRAALAEVDPARVTAGVIGLAGGLIVATALDRVWSAAGLLITPRLVSDLELAYAAGTFGPAGSVLLSGTGAAAAHCRDFRPVRTADGHGWLLGDRGSGYWLGRAAVETALAANDRGELDGLAAQVVRTLAGPHPPGPRARSAVIAAAHADAPVRLARLAPLVLTAATAGDPQARRLVERAADHLLDSLATVRAPHSELPVVLAGGVLAPDSPLSAEVRARIAGRWPDAPLTHAGNTAGAAAWLATRQLGPTDGALHTRLTTGDQSIR
ncbi:N-acetylglucosamine kinase-like BadF-type ATPase [Kitasatospora gansuensis]|uniref:N-acetylglucosamine kinase-like BadF-type ATPase n=1 Tax=Kitasatospora gansuensis TaxID=258050 RepID=A0A7W7SJH8_9ACTN|nr:BadF/BadG/BcrA/BcrD ATPase family protein [Kitasatospora gansuensis]MBB4951603.1 N-acetylglucosamine kinase-like BadF-type ATPase [Kitasatospora gansuensis]